MAPKHDGFAIDLQLLGDGAVGLSFGRGQHDLTPQADQLRRAEGRHPLAELRCIGFREFKRRRRSWHQATIAQAPQFSSYLLGRGLDMFTCCAQSAEGVEQVKMVPH